MFEHLFVLNVYLAEERDRKYNNRDRDAAIFLREWVAEAILPPETFAEPSPYSMSPFRPLLREIETNMRCITGKRETLTPDGIARFRAMSLLGVLTLSRLEKIQPFSKDESIVAVLTCLASFTDLDDRWTDPKAMEYACSLSEDYAASDNLPPTLTEILQDRVKPLFAKTNLPAITRQSRKAIDPVPSASTAHSDLEAEAKPWKYRDAYIVTVFRWVLSHLNVRTIAKPFVSMLWLI